MSGRACSVCSRPDRAEIDGAIVAAESKRGIARRFAVSPDAVERHARAHLPAAIVKAQEAEDVANGDSLLRQIQDLQRRTLALLSAAENDGEGMAALRAIHEARENVAFLSKLLAELRPPAPKPNPADALRFARSLATEAGVSVEELLTLAEKIASATEGESGSPAVLAAIAAAAEAARTGLRADLA